MADLASMPSSTETKPTAPPGLEVVEMKLPPMSLSARLIAKVRRVIGNWHWSRTLRQFGSDSLIDFPARVLGGQSIVIGQRVKIWRDARIEAFTRADGQPTLHIGDNTIIQPGIHIGAALQVKIGTGVLMASGVYITDHDHDNFDPFEENRTHHRLLAAPVEIGDDVWLGERVIVLKGVTIGAKSVIGAGSVVSRSIPPLCVAAGVPAKVIRRYDVNLKQWVKA